ncbi:hypothetical protein OGAPHI_002695 [Ogataea philodendri]|uniref:Alkyl transferase n=1 Tax=Ogataea philodendri TaxID=1378263 RepID=A0A9P8PC27_9ASCO|nr:uncharacterized protein OGAPHI_002695 [Ogataea philodendri]KAH3668940.1 hypothetical protein OGAPHI_002695 [Ogataea philodendri]
MDGNRRYAKNAGLPLKEGHRAGAESLAKVLTCCYKLGVKDVTVYAFSIENFNRPQSEIDTIFQLLKSRLAYIAYEDSPVKQFHLSIKIVGNRTLIPSDVLADLEQIEESTAGNTAHNLFIAFPYTSRDDIVHSVTEITHKVKSDELKVSEITAETIENNFYYRGEASKVDILVRTSGHTRLSDYMLWQCHQDSVISYSNTLWPNFKFYHTWWTIFKWSYYKTLILEDAETMQIKRITDKEINERYKEPILSLSHPPFASVTKVT